MGSISGNYSVLLNVCCKMSNHTTAVIVQIVAQMGLQRVDDQPSVIFFCQSLVNGGSCDLCCWFRLCGYPYGCCLC